MTLIDGLDLHKEEFQMPAQLARSLKQNPSIVYITQIGKAEYADNKSAK